MSSRLQTNHSHMSEGFGGIEKNAGFPDGWITAEVKPDGGDITNGD